MRLSAPDALRSTTTSIAAHARVALLAALATLPFLFPYHARPLTTFHVEWFTFVLALAFVSITLASSREPVPRASLALAAFAAYVMLQALWLPYWERSAIGAAYPLLAGLVLWAAASLRSAPAGLWLLRALAAGGFLMALSGVGEYFADLLTVDRPAGFGMVGTLGQRNMFAAYLACGLAALLALRAHWGLALTLGLPMAVAAAYSGSRLCWLILPAAALAARDRRALALWAACFTAFVAFRLGPAAAAVTREAVDAASNAHEAVESRWALASLAWRVWLDHPMFGAGFGEFAYQSYLHLRPGDPAGLERHAHNAALQLLAETGVVGTGILFAGFVAWARRVEWNKMGRSATARALASLLLIVGIYSCAEFPLWHAQLLVLTAAVMGILTGKSTR